MNNASEIADSKQRRALLVGAGGMGREWAKNLKRCPQVELAGWVDIVEGAAEQSALQLEFSDIACGSNLGRMLESIKPDFVVDVTIPQAHRDVTIESLRAGVPVLGEKPMADSMERAREMVAASEATGKLYMVSQSRRYNARLAAMRKLVTDRVGMLGILNSDFYLGVHFGGFRDEMASPLLLDMAIHTFDAARYLSGADAVSVYCDEFNPPWSWYKGNASATVIFEMTGGLRYTYRGSWCSDGQHTSWEGQWRAVGPNGSATWDGTAAPQADHIIDSNGFFRKVETTTAVIDETFVGGIAGSLQDFLHALDTGRTPMGECHDNIKSLAMVFAAIESARTGKRVPVSL